MNVFKCGTKPIEYSLINGSDKISINELIGKEIKLSSSGDIFCLNCSTKTEESHHQGYCATCASSLASCDRCRIKPELCHYSQGTCRQPQWGEDNCLKPHIVYLSYTSGFKVGITRAANLPDRWIDQGATCAVPLFEVRERLISGEVEEAFKKLVADKTNWRKMLMSDEKPTESEILAKVEELVAEAKDAVDALSIKFGADSIKRLTPEITNITYPMGERPFEKVGMPHNLDKKPELSGKLHGIKGQYLYIGNTIINFRKYAGYKLSITEL